MKWEMVSNTSSIPTQGTLQENADVSTPHKVKCYADVITIISTSPKELQEIASHEDNGCKDICLRIRPDKCYSLNLDGKEAKAKFVINISGKPICSIKEKPTSFLGSNIYHSKSSTSKISCSKFSDQFSDRLSHLDDTSITGEFKLWVYRRYLVLSVNCLTHYHQENELSHHSIHQKVVWAVTLNLCGCVTQPISAKHTSSWQLFHHCEAISPSSIALSSDPLIQEVANIATSSSFSQAYSITDEARPIALQLQPGL